MSCEKDWDYLFTWHIEDFSFCNQDPGVELVSPTFSVESLKNTKWYLLFCPGGEHEEFKEYVSCFLGKSEDNVKDEVSVVDFEIRIILSGNTLHADDITENEIWKGGESGFFMYFERDKLFSKMKKYNSDILTLQCCIKSHRESKDLIGKSESRTLTLTDKCFFAWNIKIINDIFVKDKRYFCLSDTFFMITIGTSQDDVTLMIQKIFENDSVSPQITGEISLLDIKGNKTSTKRATLYYSAEHHSDVSEFPSFITKEQLLHNAKDDGTIVLHCEFYMPTKSEPITKTAENSSSTAYSDVENLTHLSSDLRNLFINKSNADVKLKVNSDIELQAHKMILAARSPVFAAMFKQEMLENRTGIINLEDVDATILDLFLKFLYTGVVDDLKSETAIQLLVLADKYEVPSLKQKCGFYLITVVSVENVWEILSLADMVCHEPLKTCALEFAAKHSAEVFAAPDLKKWIKSNPNLSAEIMSYLGKKISS